MQIKLTENDWYWVLYGREVKVERKRMLSAFIPMFAGLVLAIVFFTVVPSYIGELLGAFSFIIGAYPIFHFVLREAPQQERKLKELSKKLASSAPMSL